MTCENEGLVGKIIQFGVFLKDRGFKVFQSSIQDALRGLEIISLEDKEAFFFCLRSTLATTDLEWAQFETLFDEFWNRADEAVKKEEDDPHGPDSDSENTGDGDECQLEAKSEQSEEEKDPSDREWFEGVAFSPIVSTVEKKDLGCFHKADVQVANLALKKIMEPFKLDKSRRSRRSRKSGKIDFQRIIRRSLKTGGTPLKLFYKQKKKRLKRLVILADVSGSMDRYAQFVMPFLLGLRGVGSRAEVFVFSTSLTPITFSIRHMSLDKVVARIAREVPDWSGGTRIGFSLHQFNETHGQRLLSQRTVVVVLSDGWDLGGKDLLRREMRHLRCNCHSVIWLNPLAGDPDYELLCRGMNTALPYVDHFMAANSLQSLKKVGSLLARVMVH